MIFHVLGMGYLLRLSIRLRLLKSCVLAAVGFSSGFVSGFGFGFQIIILEATGFGFGFLNFKTEATGFGFGLDFLSSSWLRLRLRSHQSGFQPNPGSHGSYSFLGGGG